MKFFEEDDFNFGNGNDEVDEEEVVETEEVETEDPTDTTEEVETEQEDEIEEEEDVEEKPKKDSRIQALDSERAKRKKAEKRIKELESMLQDKELAKNTEFKMNSEKEAMATKLRERGVLDDEVINELVETLGMDIIRNKIAGEEQDFERQVSDLSKNEMYYDILDHKKEVKELVDKGLSMKSAYFAVMGENKIASIMKDLKVEAEQKVLNNAELTNQINVGGAQSKGTTTQNKKFTKQEQSISRELGLNPKDVRKRMSAHSLDDMFKLKEEK